MALNKKHWFVVVSFKTELFSEYIIQNGYKHMGNILGIDFSFRNRKNVDNDICGVMEVDDTKRSALYSGHKAQIISVRYVWINTSSL